MDDQLRQYHRYFGIMLMDRLAGSAYQVEIELETSLQQQFLDVAIIERRADAASMTAEPELPDGLGPLAPHNLVTFKSHREALTPFAVCELVGHYVSYRKLKSPRNGLLPEEDFRLLAVCARRPEELFRRLPPREVSPGVWDLAFGALAVRVLAARDLPHRPANAALLAFSAAADDVQYAAGSFRPQSGTASGLLAALFKGFVTEGLSMPYTMADFEREMIAGALARATPEARLAGLPPEARLAGLPPEARLKGLSRAEIEAYLATLDAPPRPPRPEPSN